MSLTIPVKDVRIDDKFDFGTGRYEAHGDADKITGGCIAGGTSVYVKQIEGPFDLIGTYTRLRWDDPETTIEVEREDSNDDSN